MSKGVELARVIGQPTKYRKEFVDLLPGWFSNGESLPEVLVYKLGISRRTFYNWLDEYPEFKAAWVESQLVAEAWHIQVGRGLALGQIKGNPIPWIFTMKNRFGWRNESILKIQDEREPVKLIDSGMTEKEAAEHYRNTIQKRPVIEGKSKQVH